MPRQTLNKLDNIKVGSTQCHIPETHKNNIDIFEIKVKIITYGLIAPFKPIKKIFFKKLDLK